jgi:hypothetical protein
MLTEQVAVILAVVKALEGMDVPYAITGSFASAVHGVMRATMDADLAADLRLQHAPALAAALGEDFYADAEMSDAVRHCGSLKVIHLEAMFQADVFVARHRAFGRSQLARRQLAQVSGEPKRAAYVATAEDIVLAKLEWYRSGGELSEQQWRDVLGVLEMQAGQLSRAYMHSMARELAIADLLERAFRESG